MGGSSCVDHNNSEVEMLFRRQVSPYPLFPYCFPSLLSIYGYLWFLGCLCFPDTSLGSFGIQEVFQRAIRIKESMKNEDHFLNYDWPRRKAFRSGHNEDQR